MGICCSRKRLVTVCATTDTQSSTEAFESSMPTSTKKLASGPNSKYKNKRGEKVGISKVGFSFRSKKSREKQKKREAKRKRNAQREAHFRRQMRNGLWNNRFDHNDEIYDSDPNPTHDENYNQCNSTHHDPITKRRDYDEIKRKGSLSLPGPDKTNDGAIDTYNDAEYTNIPRNGSQQSLTLPKHESLNSSPCESFCSVQIEGELSMISEGGECYDEEKSNGFRTTDISPKKSPPVLRSILKSPRPKSVHSNEDADGETCVSMESDNPNCNSNTSPHSKPAPPTRKKSFFGSLFGPELGPVDTSFVHTATEVALDFLYPMRKIDKRKKHAKKLKETKSSWWNESSDAGKTQIPKVQSCTDMMNQYSMPKKNIVRFEIDTCTKLPDCWMNNLHVDAPFIRPASVEPPRINQELLRESDTRPEFGAYWKKAHLILRSIPQVKGKVDSKISDLSSEESDTVEDNVESSSVEKPVENSNFKDLNLNQDLTSSIPLRQLDKQLSTENPTKITDIPPTVVSSSDEWRKAKRLIKVASLFQKRLKKGVRSLSDPQIEIPNEFVSEEQRRKEIRQFIKKFA